MSATYDKARYAEMKDFEREYREKGAYHFQAPGFRGWWLRDNYRLLASHVRDGDRVLDLACGDGRLGTELGTRARVFGVDNSPSAMGLAMRNGTAGALGDMRCPPFADGTFDVVVCSLSFQYLVPDDLAQCLAAVRKLLKPGGRLAFSYPGILKNRPPASNAAELQMEPLLEITRQAGFRLAGLRGICLLLPRWVVEWSTDPRKAWVARMVYRVSTIGRYFPRSAYHYVVCCERA